MIGKRLLFVFGAACATVTLFSASGPIAASADGLSGTQSLPDGAIAGAGVLPLAGAVTLDYLDAPPASSFHHASEGQLPPLAADGGDALVRSTAAPIDLSGGMTRASNGPAADSDIVVELATLCDGVATGCTVGGDQPPVYSNASPNVASNGARIFQVFESFAARSLDNGETWSYVDPYTAFPNGDLDEFQDGFWGRQRLAQDPARDLIIWALQYGPGASDSPNGIRIAVSNAGDDLSTEPSQTWSYYDVTGAALGIREGESMEIHQLQVSNDWLYLSVNVFSTLDSSAINGGIIRMSLDALAAGESLEAGELQFYNPPDAPESARTFSMTPVNGAATRMYFGSVTGETTFRVIPWDDAASTPGAVANLSSLDATRDSGANNWECTGPSFTNPCGVADTRVQAGWVTTAFGGEVGFLWNSDRRPESNRPLPFVRALVLNSSDLTLKSQPDFFTNATPETNFAWIYPSIAVNDRGHLAGTITVTPDESTTAAPQAPAMYGFIRDDLTPNASAATSWDTFSIIAGTDGPDLNDWGRWSGAVKHEGHGNTWLLAGHVMIGGSSDENTRIQNAWVMRRRDVPVVTQPGEPAAVAFTASPPAVVASGVAFAVTIEIKDAGGTTVTSETSNVTIELLGGAPGLACAGGETKAAVTGVATFSCTINAAMANARLTASSGQFGTIGPFFSVTNGGFDANCDFAVDGSDALAVLRAIAEVLGDPRPTAPCTGDANGNEVLDIEDVRLIREAVAGL